MIKRSLMLNKSAAATVSEEHAAAAAGSMQGGKTYPFHLSFTNPLYDPIQVRLHVQRSLPPNASTTNPGVEGSPEKPRRPPFAVSLPSTAFPIAAFAEAWEYEDDEDMFGDEDDLDGARGGHKDGRGKTRTVGVLERRANVTVVGGEVTISKEARGSVKVRSIVSPSSIKSGPQLKVKSGSLIHPPQFNMLVTYTYRSDDPEPENENEPVTPSRRDKAPEMKTFSFYTVVELGNIIPREEPKVDSDL